MRQHGGGEMPPRKTVEMARRLRRAMTAPEIRLWQHLRTRPGGFKFRKQHPIGGYALDFYCAAAKLGIEVDGEIHASPEQRAHDERRDAWLLARGIRVVRFAASDVMRDLDSMSRAIIAECGEFPLHQPSAGPPPHAAHGEEEE